MPSYLLKLQRAEKHFADLEEAINAYGRQHLYEVRVTVESENNVKKHRLVILRGPDPEVSLIAGDFINNVRAGLDHLASALVPLGDRRKVYFPILWEGVWDYTGDDAQRREQRKSWKRWTRQMKPAAVAILKELQPPYRERESDHPDIHRLRIIQWVSNSDKHSALPPVSTGLTDTTVRWEDARGEHFSAQGGTRPEGRTVHHQAELMGIPDDAVNVQIEGTPVVAVRVSDPEGDIRIPQQLAGIVGWVRESIIERLVPFIQP